MYSENEVTIRTRVSFFIPVIDIGLMRIFLSLYNFNLPSETILPRPDNFTLPSITMHRKSPPRDEACKQRES